LVDAEQDRPRSPNALTVTNPLLQLALHADADEHSVLLASFGLVGTSHTLVDAVQIALKVATHRGTTVLIGGETGTGKELFARGIHHHGCVDGEPFVAINCAAIPETLLEAELFGYEQGAFTDARETRPGLVESAGAGTLFLDEVCELPLALQPKLLRMLENRTVRRVGGTVERDVRCRIIAGSNVRLEDAVADGRFREDLYYRLNVVRIELPTLRERSSDIVPLAQHFLREIAARRGDQAKQIDGSASEVLMAHDWPGNIRELKNVMERATLFASGTTIRRTDVRIQRRELISASASGALEAGRISIPKEGKSLAEVERETIRLTMLITAGNLSAAARILGIARPTLARKMRESGLTRRSLLASS
jgi:two-component system, NtrC family, response regulator AtoC